MASTKTISAAKTTAKDFFLWAGAMISLYWSVIAFILLMFDYINYAMPNPLSYYSDPYQSSIPYDMASIIVLFPIYLVLMWCIRRDIRLDASRQDIWVRRWLIIFTLFIAGVTVAIDLIVLLTTFLRGEELTMAFLLKVLVVLCVAAIVFMHFIADLWGYWKTYPMRATSVGVGVGLLGLLSIVAGFFIVGTPAQARLYRLDDQKVNDLRAIQYRVINYWQHKGVVPAGLEDLSDTLSDEGMPTDPQTGASYTYRPTSENTFELCATFNQQNSTSAREYSYPMPIGGKGAAAAMENWNHGAGETCFTRVIDADLYPVQGS